jgi:hypothetical protein
MRLPQFRQPSNTYLLIREALLRRKSVKVQYKGYERLVCPHTLGTKNGREKVLTFQYGGGSSSGLPPGGEWRCMFLEEVTFIGELDDEWHTNTNHSQPQTCVDAVDVETS